MRTQIKYTAALLLLMAAPAFGQQTGEIKPIISVVGEGKAAAPPDMATIRTGVVSQAETAKAALEENNAAMEEIISLLKRREIAEKDIQTSSFNVGPVHEHDPRGRTPPKVVGYQVHNEVQVRVRNLATLGEVLDALVQAGSNQVSGVTFDVGEPSGIFNEARSRAIRDAKAHAEVYAQTAGVEIGRVLQIREQPVEEPPRPLQLGMELRAAADSVPIATGEQEFRVKVNVVYELKRSNND